MQLGDAWGRSCSIDLYDCSPELIRSRDKIAEFTKQLVDLIEMKAYGEPQIVHFGEEERVAGYTLVQLIETSMISAHFANASNGVYLDIFSCKDYEPQQAADFAKEFFQAKSLILHQQLRQ